MKKYSCILSFLLFYSHVLFAQFFAKVDEDFKFNGVPLRVDENHTKNCTMIEENESYRVWRPEKNVLKTKQFTLRDIKYITNFRNQIWQIRAICTGDVDEQEKIKEDMAKKAKRSGKLGPDSNPEFFYNQMRTTNFYKKKADNDTAVIFIMLDLYSGQNADYRQHHSFFPFLNKPLKNEATRDFLFAYAPPDSRSGFDNVRYLTYYNYGLELYIRDDTLIQATIYNKDGKYSRYAGEIPYNLSLDDTRKDVKEKLGEPPSKAKNGSAWYYLIDDKQVHIKFFPGNDGKNETDADKIRSVLVAQKPR